MDGAQELKALYNQRILELAGAIPRQERLADPDATVRKVSPVCGSRVTIDLSLDAEERVAAYGAEVRACTLGQAAASLMARHVVGRPAEELLALRERMRALLKEGAPPPGADFADGTWQDLAVLEPVRAYKSRHGSVMLTFEAVADAIGRIRTARTATSA